MLIQNELKKINKICIHFCIFSSILYYIPKSIKKKGVFQENGKNKYLSDEFKPLYD